MNEKPHQEANSVEQYKPLVYPRVVCPNNIRAKLDRKHTDWYFTIQERANLLVGTLAQTTTQQLTPSKQTLYFV